MPLAKALKSFTGRYGQIRAGTTFHCDPKYFTQLKAKGWLIEAPSKETKAADPGPTDNRNIEEAPDRAGNESRATSGAQSEELEQRKVEDNPAMDQAAKGSAGRRGAGKAVTSRSLRQDLQSKSKTSSESDAGGSSPENPDKPNDAS